MIADSLKKEPVAFALTSIGHVAGWLFPTKTEGERTVKALLDENERLRFALQTIHDTFSKDIEQGYKAKDKTYAIEIAKAGLGLLTDGQSMEEKR